MMTCAEARPRLAGLVYADLPCDEAVALEKHLAGCPDCRQERAALAGVRRLLDEAAAPPAVQVDLPGLYATAVRRKQARSRRWRRAAALAGLAAAVVLLCLLKLEVRLEGQQVVLRWGTAPETSAPHHEPMPRPMPEVAGPEGSAADLALVKELIHALAASAEARDQDCQQALLRLEQRLDNLQGQAQARWEATQRYVSALTTVQLDSHEKGGNQ